MSVSFTSNSLSVVDDQTMTYTVQKGNTLCTLAKEIAEETRRSYKECYTDLLKQNDFKDAELNPEGTRDPNLIYAKSAKHEADVLKFTVDAEAKGKLSSFCVSSAPTADAAAADRDAEAASVTAWQSARFADRPPVIYVQTVPVEEDDGVYCLDGDECEQAEVCEDEEYAERFYYEGPDGVAEFSTEDAALAAAIEDDAQAALREEERQQLIALGVLIDEDGGDSAGAIAYDPLGFNPTE